MGSLFRQRVIIFIIGFIGGSLWLYSNSLAYSLPPLPTEGEFYFVKKLAYEQVSPYIIFEDRLVIDGKSSHAKLTSGKLSWEGNESALAFHDELRFNLLKTAVVDAIELFGPLPDIYFRTVGEMRSNLSRL
jgi:hypothetical protein